MWCVGVDGGGEEEVMSVVRCGVDRSRMYKVGLGETSRQAPAAFCVAVCSDALCVRGVIGVEGVWVAVVDVSRTRNVQARLSKSSSR